MNVNFLNYIWEWDFIFFQSSYQSLYFFSLFLLKYLFLSIFILTLFSILVFNFSKNIQLQNFKQSSLLILKFLNLAAYFISMFYLFIYIYVYNYIIVELNNYYYNNDYIINPYYNFLNIGVSLDFFGIVLLMIAYFSGLLSFLALDNKLYWKNIKYMFYLNIFVLIVFFYVSTNNILVLFIFYEFLLIPSFLLVYFLAPSRKSTQASLYFVIWTQIGSFFVLLTTFYIISATGQLSFFMIKNYNFTQTETFFLSLVLFLGFGFKIPIWPFHYWLTKTHVEAPSGFSMYLSGFLVKTALYGFYKLSSLFGGEINSIFFSTICIIGIVDSSLKMWGQTDLKKLVAYGTVQEMNIIYLTLCWGDSLNVISGILFCITHALLSVLMFYLVDVIYRRYNSRSVIEVSGILQRTPNLAILIFIMCIFFSGLPGTLKFTVEFYIFSSFFYFSPFSCLFTFFIANCLGLIGFSKCWFNSIFGMSYKNTNQLILDVTIKEFYIIFITLFLLFISCFLPNLLF